MVPVVVGEMVEVGEVDVWLLVLVVVALVVVILEGRSPAGIFSSMNLATSSSSNPVPVPVPFIIFASLSSSPFRLAISFFNWLSALNGPLAGPTLPFLLFRFSLFSLFSFSLGSLDPLRFFLFVSRTISTFLDFDFDLRSPMPNFSPPSSSSSIPSVSSTTFTFFLDPPDPDPDPERDDPDPDPDPDPLDPLDFLSLFPLPLPNGTTPLVFPRLSNSGYFSPSLCPCSSCSGSTVSARRRDGRRGVR